MEVKEPKIRSLYWSRLALIVVISPKDDHSIMIETLGRLPLVLFRSIRTNTTHKGHSHCVTANISELYFHHAKFEILLIIVLTCPIEVQRYFAFLMTSDSLYRYAECWVGIGYCRGVIRRVLARYAKSYPTGGEFVGSWYDVVVETARGLFFVVEKIHNVYVKLKRQSMETKNQIKALCIIIIPVRRAYPSSNILNSQGSITALICFISWSVRG